jgi:hypothetical protein
MLKKVKYSQKGPSWLEVGLGALLSLVLGIVLGAAYMINKPVTKATSTPKDAPAGAVYLIEGSKDLNMNGLEPLRKAFLAGQSVTVGEGEINSFLSSIAPPPPTTPPAPKPGDKNPPSAPDQRLIETSAVNAWIHDGSIQFSDTATFSLLGVSTPVIVQATGVFRKSGSEFEFDPDTIFVGGCPMERMLFFRSWILRKLLFAQPVPADIALAWSRLVDVSIDGTKLKLMAP